MYASTLQRKPSMNRHHKVYTSLDSAECVFFANLVDEAGVLDLTGVESADIGVIVSAVELHYA
jgi:hypothetical protein